MKKNLLLAALLGLASALTAPAEVLTPYTEQFENPTFRPKGWQRATASSYAAGSYTVHDTGGHSGGYITAKQYGNTYSSYYQNYSYIDVLITPKLTGEMSLWVRANGTSPSLTFYEIKDGATVSTSSKMLEGTTKNMLDGLDITDWTKVTVPDVAAGTCVGIRAHNLDIDEFAAASADVTYRASLISDVTNTSGGTKLEADADGKVTIKFKVSVENDGDIDFPASDEGFKIELFNYSVNDQVFGTDKITDAVPSGSKVEKEFSMSGTPVYADGVVSYNYKVNISHAKTGTVTASLAYFTIVPYEPAARFMYGEDNDKNESSYNNVNITGSINVGAGAAGTTRTLWMWNAGTAPMEISSVAVTDGFTTTAGAFTLQRGEKKEVPVSLAGAPGRKDGTITFTDAKLGAITYNLAGLVTKEGDWMHDFEGEPAAAGFILGNSWKLKDTPAALATLGGSKMVEQQSSGTQAKMMTPRITFAEGDVLGFMASKTDNLSSTMKVYTSPDRVNWTEVYAIDAKEATDAAHRFSADKPTGTGYGTYEHTLFTVPMQAGECYVAFEAGGARLDNICGGKLTDVAHDIYVQAQNTPVKGYVNTRFITSITLENVAATPETDYYAIVLEANGQEVARTTDAPELVAGTPVTFDLRFTPHDMGELTGKYYFVSGDDKIELSSFTSYIDAERTEATYQVGTVKITTTDPLNTSYQGSQCQIIYTPEMLGMDAGMKVTGFSFTGYISESKDFTRHVKVWIDNTTDVAHDPTDVKAAKAADMTLVYDADYTFSPCGDSYNKVYETVFDIPFTTPFPYTGGSLRLMIECIGDTPGMGMEKVFCTVDNSAYDYWNDKYDDKVIENKKEYAEDLEDEAEWNIYRAGYPVTFFSVAKDVVNVTGTVTDDFKTPVADCLIFFESDDIQYRATTDTEGKYSMNVGNIDLTYHLTAVADDLDREVKYGITLSADEPVHTIDIALAYTDRSATLSGIVYNTAANGPEPLEGAAVRLDYGAGAYVTLTDAEGKYTITTRDFSLPHTLLVSKMGGYDDGFLYDEPYTFKSKADEKDIDVVFHSGVEGVSADAKVSVKVSGNDIIVDAPAGMPLTLHDARGIELGRTVSDGSATTFGPLSLGLYIVAGTKVVVK